MIEKDKITVKNGNRAHGIGILDIKTFEPFAKNPSISKVFREIGFADELGSGMRNSYKYTKLYSGAEPEFIEGDVFKIIIPLTTGAMTKVGPGTNIKNEPKRNAVKKVPLESAVKKVPLENAVQRMTGKTEEQRKKILEFLSDGEWRSSTEIMVSTDVRERRIRILLNSMVEDGLLLSMGEKRWRRYRRTDV